MSEFNTNLNPLDSSLVDLKISERTLERITELENLNASDNSVDAIRGSEAEPLDLSLKDTSSSSFILNYLNDSNFTDETDKFHELHQSVNGIFNSTGEPINEQSHDIPYFGVTASVAEILLQHGEFPASRKLDKNIFHKNVNNNLVREKNATLSAFKRFNTAINESRQSGFLTMSSLPSLMSWGIEEGEAPSSNLFNNMDDLEKSSLQTVSRFDDISNRSWNTNRMPSLLYNYRPFPSVISFDETSDKMKSFDNYVSLENEKSTTMSSLVHNKTTSKYYSTNLCDKYKLEHTIRPSLQHSFIQTVALDLSTHAFKSHPLYPLLRDLATADYYFDHADFDIAPLLAFLPSSSTAMIKVYLERHPEAKKYNKYIDYQSEEIDSVIMDAIHFAHKNLLDRVRNLQIQATGEINAEVAATEEVVEHFCKKFMDVIQCSTPLNTPLNNTIEEVRSPDPYFEQPKLFSPIISNKSPQSSFHTRSSDICVDHKHTRHSKKAVKILTQWLKEHCDKPFPNEQEKYDLADMAGLTQQQVSHWFMNARRRLLPRLRHSLVHKEMP